MSTSINSSIKADHSITHEYAPPSTLLNMLTLNTHYMLGHVVIL